MNTNPLNFQTCDECGGLAPSVKAKEILNIKGEKVTISVCECCEHAE